MATGTDPAKGRLGNVWSAVAAAGEDMHVLSLLTFTMAFLVLQAGLLARINYLHGQPDGSPSVQSGSSSDPSSF